VQKKAWYRDRMMFTALKTGSAGILPAFPRACPELAEGASRPRRRGRGRPPDSRRGGGATLRGERAQNHTVTVLAVN